MSRDHGASDTKVYIGNLGSHPPSTAEVEKEMSYYGKLVSVWIARRPPGFGYIEFEDPRDAKDAIRDLDGRFDHFFLGEVFNFNEFKIHLTLSFNSVLGQFLVDESKLS